MKIFFHAPAGYTYFFREALKFAGGDKSPCEFGVILYTNVEGLLGEFKNLVGDANVFYLQDKLNEYMKDKKPNLAPLKDFPATIYECVSTSKVHPGHISLQDKSREYQIKIMTGTYLAYKEFLTSNTPDAVVFPILEAYDSIILYHLCKELGIEPVIYGHARNIGMSYFSDSIYEDLPPYALKKEPPPEAIKKAEEFIRSFRKSFKPSFVAGYNPSPDEIIDTSFMKTSIFKKAFNFVKMKIHDPEPHRIDRYTLIHHLRIQIRPYVFKYRRLKGGFNRVFYDLRKMEDLPDKFIYYPLQYTPEASINTPAPFFVDQMRAIDLILNSMPPDFYLVVKEHPAMIGERPFSFYRALKKKAGILLADIHIPSIEITKKASLTASVTGTACLEAFLLGKPSLHLGRAFFTGWIYKFDCFSDFKKVIREGIDSRVVSMEKIIDLVSRVFSAGGDFIVASPPYMERVELLMNKRNIGNFLESLLRHVKYFEVRSSCERKSS